MITDTTSYKHLGNYSKNDMAKFYGKEVSRVVGREVPVDFTWVRFAEIDIPDPPYHKSVSQTLIEREYKNFNGAVAQYLSVNMREDNQIALMDGRHRKGLIIANGGEGWWAILTYGLTIAEEAMWFRYCTKRKNMNTSEEINALIIEGDQDSKKLLGAMQSEGFTFNFCNDKKRITIRAASAMKSIYETGGVDAVKRVLRVVNKSWIPNSHSLSDSLLRALNMIFNNKEANAIIKDNILIQQLSRNNPDCIVQTGRRDSVENRCRAVCGIAQHIVRLYNSGRPGKRIKVNFVRDVKQGRPMVVKGLFPDNRKEFMVIPSVQVEINNRKILGKLACNKKISVEMKNEIERAFRFGFTMGEIIEMFSISAGTAQRAAMKVR